MTIFFLLTAYILGSIPFGYVVARLIKKIDIRQHGSGNIGTTNVMRVVGKPWGITVLLLDATKGYIAVVLPAIWYGNSESSSFLLQLALGVLAILGHSFPIWLGFKGGKGVATSLGVFLAIASLPTLLTFGIWLAVFFWTHIISISSLVAAFCFPVVIFLTSRSHPHFGWLFLIGIALTAFISYTHRANVRRILKGEEKKLF